MGKSLTAIAYGGKLLIHWN